MESILEINAISTYFFSVYHVDWMGGVDVNIFKTRYVYNNFVDRNTYWNIWIYISLCFQYQYINSFIFHRNIVVTLTFKEYCNIYINIHVIQNPCYFSCYNPNVCAFIERITFSPFYFRTEWLPIYK